MALVVTHVKNVAIADDPKAAAAGEVLPSDWNANHTVTGVAIEQAGGNLTFFVSTTGSDSNPGTQAQPFRTIQHAISVVLGFDYQGLYQPTINVADGTYAEAIVLPVAPLNYLLPSFGGGAFIIGNTTTPTNCIIAPPTGSPISLSLVGGRWEVSGFSFKPCPDSGSILINVANGSFLFGSPIDLNTGTGIDLSNWVVATSYSRIFPGSILTSSKTWTVQGDGGTAGGSFFGAIAVTRWSEISFSFGANQLIFNSAINLNSNPFFLGDISGEIDVTTLIYTTPGNITNGTPVSLKDESILLVGSDPTTITWPGGAFDPTRIDASSAVDGNFYALQKAGLPANTDMYKGAWRFVKDTSGGGVYAAYNDAGTIKKVALT